MGLGERETSVRMRLIIFSTDYPPLIGGISTYSYQLARNLVKMNRVTVLAPHAPGDRAFDARQPFQTVRVANVPVLRELLCMTYILWLHAQERIDCIVNTVWFPCGLLSYYLSRVASVRYVVGAYASEMLDDNRSLKRQIKGLLSGFKIKTFLSASMMLAVSQYTKGKLVEMGCPSEKVMILNAGVDVGQFCPGAKADALARKHGIGKGDLVLLSVGRLDLHKGHDIVLRALPKILEEVPNLIYLIVGDGPERAHLQALAEDYGLSAKVQIIGQVEDEHLVEYYRLCDVFVMPSREIEGRVDLIEGFGMVFLEANACAKPVIGGLSGGVPDAVLDKETGLLVDPTSPEEVAAAVILLCKDKAYADKLGHMGLKRCRDVFSWPAICQLLQRVLEKIAGTSEKGEPAKG